MKVLAFDSTGPILTVGAAENHKPVGRLDVRAERRKGNLLDTMIDDLLKKVGWSRSDVEGLGLLTGPGSLTAARIGWATAAAWSQAARIPVTGWTVPAAHRRLLGEDALGAMCCVHYRGETFLLYDLSKPDSAAQSIIFNGSEKSGKPLRVLTGPGVIYHREKWEKFYGASTRVATDDPAIIGGDILAVWAEEDIARGVVLSTDHSPLEYGLPPDFKKLPTA